MSCGMKKCALNSWRFEGFCPCFGVWMLTTTISNITKRFTGWWCRSFFIFTPTWGRFPIWRAYFSNWVSSTTNQASARCSWGKPRWGFSRFTHGFCVSHPLLPKKKSPRQLCCPESRCITSIVLQRMIGISRCGLKQKREAVGGLVGWLVGGLGWVSCGFLGPFQPEVEFTPKARRCDQCVWACRILEVSYLIHPWERNISLQKWWFLEDVFPIKGTFANFPGGVGLSSLDFWWLYILYHLVKL